MQLIHKFIKNPQKQPIYNNFFCKKLRSFLPINFSGGLFVCGNYSIDGVALGKLLVWHSFWRFDGGILCARNCHHLERAKWRGNNAIGSYSRSTMCGSNNIGSASRQNRGKAIIIEAAQAGFGVLIANGNKSAVAQWVGYKSACKAIIECAHSAALWLCYASA
jgi:hypothetical protein